MVDNKPYEEYNKDDYRIRFFDRCCNNSELIWHKDKKNRTVEVVNGGGWEMQFDNQLPFKLTTGMIVEVPKETFHRVLKGSDNLVVKIIEID